MGSRGSFLKEGGFSASPRWHVEKSLEILEGSKKTLVEILAPNNPSSSIGLPERSNSPNAIYVIYGDKDRNKGVFKQLNVFDENRMPIYEIDYGPHKGVKSLHVHTYVNGDRKKGMFSYLHEGDVLYERFKQLFKGVKL